jgi:hypothetical protein
MESSAMPPLDNPRLLRTLIVEHDGDLVDWVEILTPDLGRRDPALATELRRMIDRYRLRQVVKEADEVLFHGRCRRLLQRLGVLRHGKASLARVANPDNDATA